MRRIITYLIIREDRPAKEIIDKFYAFFIISHPLKTGDKTNKFFIMNDVKYKSLINFIYNEKSELF